MKKSIAIFLAAMLTLSLVACGQKTPTSPVASSVAEPSAVTAAESAQKEDTSSVESAREEGTASAESAGRKLFCGICDGQQYVPGQ